MRVCVTSLVFASFCADEHDVHDVVAESFLLTKERNGLTVNVFVCLVPDYRSSRSHLVLRPLAHDFLFSVPAVVDR